MKPRLIMMVKEPKPGRVKTRLGRDLGYVRAAWWYRHQTARTLRNLQDPRWEIVLAVSPDKHAHTHRIWPTHVVRTEQGRGDLGVRMRRQFSISPPTKTCIIGSDIPGISKAHIQSSFAELGSNDAVFGPAHDGGYWLIGLAHPARAPREFMQGVRWSTEHALHDTLNSAKELSWGQIDVLSDVDTLADLKALNNRP